MGQYVTISDEDYQVLEEVAANYGLHPAQFLHIMLLGLPADSVPVADSPVLLEPGVLQLADGTIVPALTKDEPFTQEELNEIEKRMQHYKINKSTSETVVDNR